MGLSFSSGVAADCWLHHPKCLKLCWIPQALPSGVKERCEDPLSRYNFGWSHGKETLAGGRPDVNKGSFYANPLHNSVTDDPKLIAAFPTYCR